MTDRTNWEVCGCQTRPTHYVGTMPCPQNTAPAPPAVSVTDEMAAKVLTAFSEFPVRLSNPQNGRDMIAAVQSVLGPTLGLVTREEMAREVEAAYREGYHEARCDGELPDKDGAWKYSDARERLEGGR